VSAALHIKLDIMYERRLKSVIEKGISSRPEKIAIIATVQDWQEEYKKAGKKPDVSELRAVKSWMEAKGKKCQVKSVPPAG
jgi:hypothetical protein